MNMNAVGIDVSKGKSMVAILRPFGEIVSTPFEVKHTVSGIRSLIEHIKAIDGESRIVMEHTGRYYEPLVRELSQADLFVSAVNPKLIKDFGDNSLRKVKSDKADAVKIARYTLDSWTELRQYSLMDEIRNQLKTMNRQFDFYMKYEIEADRWAAELLLPPDELEEALLYQYTIPQIASMHGLSVSLVEYLINQRRIGHRIKR